MKNFDLFETLAQATKPVTKNNTVLNVGEYHRFNGKMIRIIEKELHNWYYVEESSSHPNNPICYSVNINDIDLID